jgi:hypothetical protein
MQNRVQVIVLSIKAKPIKLNIVVECRGKDGGKDAGTLQHTLQVDYILAVHNLVRSYSVPLHHLVNLLVKQNVHQERASLCSKQNTVLFASEKYSLQTA